MKKKNISIGNKSYTYYSIKDYNIEKLPFSIRVLLENLLRKYDDRIVKKEHINEVLGFDKNFNKVVEIPFYPARVIMQDFTGVPAVVDLASARDKIKELGGDPKKVNPLVDVDLIIDHSVQVDFYGTNDALEKNMDKEFERNSERYRLLKWAQKAFNNMRIFPPGSGIIHQINLEYIAKVVREKDGVLYPDTVIGTDSHTTMINGIGVLGWGVGGIEAEAVMLGQPYYMKLPQVVGVKLVGELKEGVTPTDLVLYIVELLRKEGVVEKFVEYFGEGYKKLSLPDRAILANMAPEYGATAGYCPVDEETINFLRLTARDDIAEIVEAYTKQNGLFYDGNDEKREYNKVIEVDLSRIEPAVAGPSRPQDRIVLKNLKEKFEKEILKKFNVEKIREVKLERRRETLKDGSIVIASITSCTNTSNPTLLIGAGILAKKAVEKGLKVKSYVKTSLGPGSRVVEKYLKEANLLSYLEKLGFNIVGYGCLTCIGNSGPIAEDIEKAIDENSLVVSSVLSGNRNFEARIHSKVKTNFLASPILVVAFALAGRINIDFDSEPIGEDKDGNPVYLKDIWPSMEEIKEYLSLALKKEYFKEKYEKILEGTHHWQELDVPEGDTYDWDKKSTYIKRVPFFDIMDRDYNVKNIKKARVLLVLGDSVTTDHISPAGAIPKDSPAGRYLIENGVDPKDFNSYGSRRGNHEVMVRGTFANVRIKNKLVAPKEGGYTLKLPEGKEMTVYEAAVEYQKEGIPLIVLAGKEYGTGSSRDWAAKGTMLLGIKAVIAESFERIHRSNLIGMGVLPLEFINGENYGSLGLDGKEEYYIEGIEDIEPGKILKVRGVKKDGREIVFNVKARLDTEVEVEYYKAGGILVYVLNKIKNGEV